MTDRQFFKVDYTLFLNLAFLGLSSIFLIWKWRTTGFMKAKEERVSEIILFWLAQLAFLWLAGGLLLAVFMT